MAGGRTARRFARYRGGHLIFLAAFHRQWAVIDNLLAHGASVDLPDRRGWTPLFWAAFKGHADIVSFLIGRGPNPDVRNSDGEWPLFWAA
ncbi:ankyrin repeat domain-containing protein [Azoarcus sp. CIB]|uniref:ankyrin repeat domain-containing protein n=1 Tax=Aromatoleum sp. (strain CIB) TaxID=198107 RepID=UPI000B1B3EE1|nr:ankyrin repeat domain-containing protein [Azoarcus sp. CIB]